MGNIERNLILERDKKEVVGASKFSYMQKARILLRSVGNGIKILWERDRDTKDEGHSLLPYFLQGKYSNVIYVMGSHAYKICYVCVV